MAVPRSESLRQENWAKLSPLERRAALQELENAIAIQEGRTACEVDFLSEYATLSPGDAERTRGLHLPNQIFINDSLLQEGMGDQPYMAVETLFHESRHAYQEHIAQNPELAEDPQQFEDFQKNSGPGYLPAEQFEYWYYAWQPTEKDAREVARQRTEALYAEEFADNTYYPMHRQQMEAEEAQNIREGLNNLGENFEEAARKMAFDQYEAYQSLAQQSSLAQNQSNLNGTQEIQHQGLDTSHEPADEEAQSQAPSATGTGDSVMEEVDRPSERSFGEEQDYSYGYGY